MPDIEMAYTKTRALPYPLGIRMMAEVVHDMSWRNDASDKIVFLLNGHVYRLWVDEAMPAHREYTDADRYTLESYSGAFVPRPGDTLADWHDGDAIDSEWEQVHSSEFADDLLEFLKIDSTKGWSKQNDTAMAEIGFVREGLGGNLEGYVKRDPTIGEVTVTSAHFEGQAPVGRGEVVLVTFTGFQHSEELLSLQLPLNVFIAQVKAAR